MPDRLLHMGRIGKPRGVQGEVTADWFGETLPVSGETIFLQHANEAPKPYILLKTRKHKGRLILQLATIANRDHAAAITGNTILLSRDSVEKPGADEAFLEDLPGCQILLENGDSVGFLDHLEYPAGQPVWVIKGRDGQEILFPGQPDFIKLLDMVKREIVVAPPEGLLDIYHA